MIYGYVRVSTLDQSKENNIDAQVAILKQNGAKKIFKEIFNGSITKRPKLVKLLDTVTAGDMIIVARVNQLGSTVTECVQLITKLLRSNIKVYIVDIGLLDGNTPLGCSILTLLLKISGLEHFVALEKK